MINPTSNAMSGERDKYETVRDKPVLTHRGGDEHARNHPVHRRSQKPCYLRRSIQHLHMSTHQTAARTPTSTHTHSHTCSQSRNARVISTPGGAIKKRHSNFQGKMSACAYLQSNYCTHKQYKTYVTGALASERVRVINWGGRLNAVRHDVAMDRV